MKANREKVEIVNFSISTAILSLVMLILGYQSIIAFAIVAVLGLLLNVKSENLTKNVFKIAFLYVIDVIYGVAVHILSLFTVKPFEWIGDILFDFDAFDASTVVLKIANFIRGFWNGISDVENFIILALYVIAAISLLKSDEIIVPFTKKLINKVISFKKDEE